VGALQAYQKVALWLFDYVNDGIQVRTFIQHGDYAFAALVGGFIAFSSLATYNQCGPGRGNGGPLEAARITVQKGVPTKLFRAMFRNEGSIESAGVGLIAPYGMTLNSGLSSHQMISALAGILLSAKSIASTWVEFRDCEERPEAMKALIPRPFLFAQMWRCCGSAMELGAFAVASRSLHPLLTVPAFLFSSGARACSSGDPAAALVGLVMPSFLFFGASSSLSLGSALDAYSGPAWPDAVGQAFRLAAWSLLCLTLDLPEGVSSWASLSRPMGYAVLREEFLAPASVIATVAGSCATSGANYIASAFKEEFVCDFEVEDPSKVFNGLLLIMLVISTSLYLVGLWIQLACNKHFRNGTCDDELFQNVRRKQQAIEHWGDEQVSAAYEQLG